MEILVLKPQNSTVTSGSLPSFVSHIIHQQVLPVLPPISISVLHFSPSPLLPPSLPVSKLPLLPFYNPFSTEQPDGPSPARHSPHFQWCPFTCRKNPKSLPMAYETPTIWPLPPCVLCPECSSSGSHMIVHSYLSSFPCFLPILYDNLLLLCLLLSVFPTRM